MKRNKTIAAALFLGLLASGCTDEPHFVTTTFGGEISYNGQPAYDGAPVYSVKSGKSLGCANHIAGTNLVEVRPCPRPE